MESPWPKGRVGTEAGGGWVWGRVDMGSGRWLSKWVCSLDLGWGWVGKQKGFHFHRPSSLGSPQFGVGTGHCFQEGVGSDTELTIENEKRISNFQTTWKQTQQWPSTPRGAMVCRQEGGGAGSAGFLQEDVRWRSAQVRGGSALAAGSLWEAEGDQVAVHFVMKLGRWRTGKSQQKDSTLLSLPPSYQGSGAGEKGRSGRGRDLEETPENIRRGGGRAGGGQGSWPRRQEHQEPRALGHRSHFRSGPSPWQAPSQPSFPRRV